MKYIFNKFKIYLVKIYFIFFKNMSYEPPVILTSEELLNIQAQQTGTPGNPSAYDKFVGQERLNAFNAQNLQNKKDENIRQSYRKKSESSSGIYIALIIIIIFIIVVFIVLYSMKVENYKKLNTCQVLPSYCENENAINTATDLLKNSASQNDTILFYKQNPDIAIEEWIDLTTAVAAASTIFMSSLPASVQTDLLNIQKNTSAFFVELIPTLTTTQQSNLITIQTNIAAAEAADAAAAAAAAAT